MARPENQDKPPGSGNLSHPWPHGFPPRGLNRGDAERYIGVSERKFDALVAAGRMPRPVRIDGRLVWDVRELDRAFDDLKPTDDDADRAYLDKLLGMEKDK